MRFKLLLTCIFTVQMCICYRHTFVAASLWIHCHSIWNGSHTVEWNTTPRSIFASPILCHTFVCPRVFLLEIGDFKDSVWILHFDFAGERHSAGSPPAYFWDRAAREGQKVPMMATVSYSDQSVIKHKRNGDGAKALWVIVPYKSKLWLLRFQKLLKRALISALLSFHIAALALLWIDESEDE